MEITTEKMHLRRSPRRRIAIGVSSLGDLLYEFPAETRLAVYRQLDMLGESYRTAMKYPGGPAQISKFCRRFNVFKIFCIVSCWFVTLRC